MNTHRVNRVHLVLVDLQHLPTRLLIEWWSGRAVEQRRREAEAHYRDVLDRFIEAAEDYQDRLLTVQETALKAACTIREAWEEYEAEETAVLSRMMDQYRAEYGVDAR